MGPVELYWKIRLDQVWAGYKSTRLFPNRYTSRFGVSVRWAGKFGLPLGCMCETKQLKLSRLLIGFWLFASSSGVVVYGAVRCV